MIGIDSVVTSYYDTYVVNKYFVPSAVMKSLFSNLYKFVKSEEEDILTSLASLFSLRNRWQSLHRSTDLA